MGDCGIFVGHSLHDTFKGLKSEQNRGRDTAGISVKTPYGIDTVRWAGIVESFSLDTMYKILEGDMFIGHVRYATSGDNDEYSLFYGAQPRFLGSKKITEYIDERDPLKHLISRGADVSIVHNGTLNGINPGNGEIDTDIILKAYIQKGIEWFVDNFPAAYAAALIDKNREETIVFRDRYGIRPLWIGKKDGKIVAASEDSAIRDIGGTPIREVNPGEVIYIPPNGVKFKSRQAAVPSLALCFFEDNYLSRPDSSLEGRIIHDTRYRLGVELAHEYSPKVDFVSFIPNTPEPMARGYSDERGIPFIDLLYKRKDTRAFMGPTEKERYESIRKNLFLLDMFRNSECESIDVSVLRGKRGLFLDDSVVRLNNAPYAGHLLKDVLGLKWAALGIVTPVLGESSGCPYGVDMPTGNEFAIKKFGSVEKMTEKSGFDEIYFLSEEGLQRAHQVSLNKRCTLCIGGPDPVKPEDMERMQKALYELDI